MLKSLPDPASQQVLLPSISKRSCEGIINPATVSRGRIDKSKAVLFFINRFEQQFSEIRLFGVFDQYSGRAIDAPHFESRSENSAGREKVVQIRHGVIAIDRGFRF